MQQGERIREARLARGMSQSDLAEALGVSKPAISRYELGQRHLQPDQLVAVSKILDVPIIELVELTPEKRDELSKAIQILTGIEERALEGQYLSDGDQWIQSVYVFLEHLVKRELAFAANSDGSQDEKEQEPLKREPMTREQILSKRRMNKMMSIFESLNPEKQLRLTVYAKDLQQIQRYEDEITAKFRNPTVNQNTED